MKNYDTEAGIEAALDRGLEGFTELARARREAGYVRREMLNTWVVLGRYFLDSCGNVFVLTETLDLPRVTSQELPGEATLRRIARDDHHCVRCGRAWTIEDAHDVVFRGEPAQPYHAECRALEVHESVRAEFSMMFEELVGCAVELRAIPNRYGSGDYAGPWFLADLGCLGTVRLGWRTHVIEIEWSEGADGRKVFADEPVTKSRNLVHANSYNDAARYLRMLAEATPLSQVEVMELGRAAFPNLKWDKIAEVLDKFS